MRVAPIIQQDFWHLAKDRKAQFIRAAETNSTNGWLGSWVRLRIAGDGENWLCNGPETNDPRRQPLQQQ
jgi:hypothetical protein